MTQFSGVIPPVVTPLISSDQLDVQSVDRIVDHLVDGGTSGLFVLGATGEGPSLTYQIRYEMVERTCQRSNNRVPVLVGVTDTCLAESIALAEHAANCGASAIVAAAPFYFDVSQTALKNWFAELAEQSPIPLMLYNMPSCVGVTLDLMIVQQLSVHPNIVGIKDSGGDLNYFRHLCNTFRGREDFVVFMGPEERLAEAVQLGGTGGVCGGANLLPQVYVRLFQAASRNDATEVAYWNATIERLFASVYRDEHGVMKLIPGLKYAMSQLGLCEAITAPPLAAVSDAHAEKIRGSLDQLVLSSRVSTAPEAV